MSNYYYEAIQVEVLESGCYNLVSNGTIDMYGFIYKDYFNPVAPTANFLPVSVLDYDGDQFELQTSLLINTKYILVMTTFYPKVTGVFSVIANGPNSVTFDRISEYL
jgi:hypothetical protein